MKCLVFVVLLMLEAFTAAVSGAGQSGVCYVMQATSQVASRTVYRPAYQSYSTTYPCGWFWLYRCRRTHYTSHQQSFISYHTVTMYSSVQQCCSGYVGVPPDCQAKCTGGCQNGGSCTLSEICTCAPGWTGINCEADINECNGNHQCDHDCTNTNGSFICSCDPGYELQSDDRTCEDTNECQTDNGGCEHTCINTAGSYQCSCQNNYELTSDNHTCTDIGECLIGTHNCSQLCVELERRYECRCLDGYKMADDEITCKDIDECAQGTSGCNQGCRNTDGSFICTCNEGYQTHHDDPTFCVDVDECVKSNGGCQHVCKNNNGSYQCLCHSGHFLRADQHGCEDYNECSNSNGGCQHNCTNIIGSYYCLCAAGYSLDDNGHSCSSIKDESSVIKSSLSLVASGLPNTGNDEDNSSNVAVPIISTIAGLVILIVLLLLTIWLIVRYLKKHSPSELPTGTNVNNAATIAAAKKEKIINEDTNL